MQDLIVSLNRNHLKVSALDKDGLKTSSADLSSDVVWDSQIKNVPEFSGILQEHIQKLNLSGKNKYRLNFLAEPKDVILRFITVNKKDGEASDQILAEIKTKIGTVDLDSMFYSYQKIAPFVYQFIGVKKEYLEKYVEISNILKIGLYSVYPWVLLLPKYIQSTDSAIFLAQDDEEQILALSELGGVFFTGNYKGEKSTEDIQKVIHDLSAYKRTQPINKIYTLNRVGFVSVEGFDVKKIEIPGLDAPESHGFEMNILVNYMLDFAQDLVSTQTNLLSLLPLPVAMDSKKSLVPVKAVAGALVVTSLLIVGLITVPSLISHSRPQNEPAVVASAVVAVEQPKETTSSVQSPVETPKEDLKKGDLVIRIENASNINGMAGKTKAILESFGYKVDSIDTADSSITATTIKFSKNTVKYKDLLLLDLKKTNPNIVVEETLTGTEKYGALVIVGTSVVSE